MIAKHIILPVLVGLFFLYTESVALSGPADIKITVSAKKSVLKKTSVTTALSLTQKDIAKQPQGDSGSISRLVISQTPGISEGPLGRLYVRGNHTHIQYQIDGIQMPDMATNGYSQDLNLRGIDSLEVITGGIPAEYGQRLGAVINIVSKTGEENSKGNIQLTYGSYNTFSPNLTYSGSLEDGKLRYFLTGAYKQTDRGLDTPQSKSPTDLSQGGSESVHNKNWANNLFGKADWIIDNANKITVTGFSSNSFYQIPTYPDSFKVTDRLFDPSFVDPYGNDNGYRFVPSWANNTQSESNHYVQMVYKHAFSEKSFLQIAPYWKSTRLVYSDDSQANLLGASAIPSVSYASFSQNRDTNHIGIKGDLSNRIDTSHLLKMGFLSQYSHSQGPISILTKTDSTLSSFSDNSVSEGWTHGIYLQDDIQINPAWSLQVGLRWDMIAYQFGTESSLDAQLSPRIGTAYFLDSDTKCHASYSRLFQPAPLENLRLAFNSLSSHPELTVYDIKAQRDNFYEIGISKQWNNHVIGLTSYYRESTNVIDNARLLNTSLVQPFNLAQGYAYGLEVSGKGQIASNWSYFSNYAFCVAKGRGLSGGLFAIDPDDISEEWQTLDHVQSHTFSTGLNYTMDRWDMICQARYGSGLATGPSNSGQLPSYVTIDSSFGHRFDWGTVWFEILNLTDVSYPLGANNGFNGPAYAVGRQFFIRISTDF